MVGMVRDRLKQAGVVSIMVTMVMMIVISLVVVGFAEISRNEQRSSLDNQLSVQAYYAAESGINDAREAISTQIQAGQTVQSKTTCGNQGSYTFNNTVDAAHDTSYTCLLIDPTPSSLAYNVGYTSTVVPVTSSGAAFGKLTLTWNLPTGTTNGSAAGCDTNATSLDQLPSAGQWNCDYPVMRVDMLDANGSLTRANWNTDTATMFFIPFNSNSAANSTTLAARGNLIPAQCDSTNCTANITGLGGTKYYMRVTTLYRTNSLLTISSGGNTFSGAEATIDATGKAQDVLRRVLAAVDLTSANVLDIPSAAIVSKDSICKQFGVTNSSFTVYDDMSAGGNGNILCAPQNSGTPPPPPPPSTSCDQGDMPPPPSGYTKTVLDDKFSGTQLNTATWNTYAGDGFGRWDDNGKLPAPYSEIGNSGEFNAEYGDPSEVTVNNGLTLGVNSSNKFSNLKYSYSAGYITSYGKFTFDHGYYQICTKIPDSNTGGWFTIWFLSPDGLKEMDLDESGFTSCGSPVNGCIHSNLNNSDVEKWYQTNTDLSAGYHALGLDYRPGNSVEIYYDGKPIISFTKDIPTGPFYALVTSTMATSKTSDWHTIISSATPSSFAFKVSEIQVWQ